MSKTERDLSSIKIFVFDTNIPVLDSSFVYKFKEHDLTIPIQVIEELDKFKKGFDSVNWHCREFVRFLDEISTDKIFNGGFSLGEGRGKIKVQKALDFDPEVFKNLKDQSVDAQIVNVAYVLKHLPENKNRQVVLVSNDVNMRLKAKALGVVAEKYLADEVTNIDSLFEMIEEVAVQDTLIDELYKSNTPVEYKKLKPYPNQNFIFKGTNKKSILVVYKEEFFHKITKDRISAFELKPKNSEQAFAMHALLDRDVSLVALEGKAGTGKTILALASALHQIGKNIYNAVYYTRQTISVGDREIGFLPGDIDDKIGPFMNGMHDNLAVIASLKGNKTKIDVFKATKSLITEPLPFIRGRSLNKVFFIIDEVQNLTPHEIKTIVTRAGEGTKIIMIGDTQQIDNPYLDQRSNGLSYLIDKFKNQKCFSHVRLIKSERSYLAELAGELL
ncbi:MAG: PhoH family protein [bacterium]|nr:PhoH family protein [bacterium]